MPTEPEILTLSSLEVEVAAAIKALQSACEERWPKGTRVSFVYSGRQVTPSTGTIHCWRGGDANIQTDKLGRRGYPTHKWRHWSRIG